MKTHRTMLLVLAAVLFVSAAVAAPADLLETGFRSPPDSARPHTWWHWMNGNITREGITADLEAMKHVGIGGAQIFNVSEGIPHGPVQFMSAEWRALFKHAVQEADRLGLELCVHNCAGWSSSGGPWNTPEHAMQQVVTSELRVSGPRQFSGPLPAPTTRLGFYRDIAVLALPETTAGTNRPPVARSALVDVTAKLEAGGQFTWDVPAGDWIILRVGHTPTGRNNHPAPPEGTGLECDKLSKEALDRHWAGFMQKILDDAGPLAGKSFNNALIDSYEVGDQNWTPKFREEFRQRRGYDLLPFLPALAGRIVDNREVTDRFLWDMNRTIADLFAENYFGHFAKLCKQRGLLTSIEPYTGPFESLQCGAPADIVMGEFWSGSQGHSSIKIAASVAHIYGKTVVAAESFTAAPDRGRWLNTPYSIKALGDLMYCQGLNRYIFHRYALQPWTNRWPGMTMGQWGFHFERTVTWWEQSKPWLEYVTRCQFLLQQGRAVADVAYFCGETAPVELRAGNPPLPAGYDWDGINADVLLHRASVKSGRLTLPDGTSYAALVLPPNDRDMTPLLLKRIGELVRDGATVVGPPPQRSPSLADYPNCDAQVKELAAGLWGKCDGRGVTENVAGNGRIVWGQAMSNVLAAGKLKPDFEFAGTAPGTRLAYVHRVAGQADLYFVSNQRGQFDTADCTFRVSGRLPELWHPDTGVIERAPVWSERDGRTTVRMSFDPAGSVFVVFRSDATRGHAIAAKADFETAPAPSQPKLELRRAVYAAVDGSGSMDVTEQVKSRLDAGDFTIMASNEAMGRDPTVNHVKQLRLDYVLDGKAASMVLPENESYTFPGAGGSGVALQWEPLVRADGVLAIKAWSDGSVEFRTDTGVTLRASATPVPAPLEVSGSWNLSFPPNWGAPPAVKLDKLISWTDHLDSGVRYFSGTATYEKEIEIPAGRLSAGRELWLDLGKVKDFAEISLNRQNLGTLWKPPFRVNATAAAKTGSNRLVVKVTNLWPNRLIGDEQLAADVEWNGKPLKAWPEWLLAGKPSPTGRLTFTTWHHWTKDSALLESGLLGPVTLRTAVVVQATGAPR